MAEFSAPYRKDPSCVAYYCGIIYGIYRICKGTTSGIVLGIVWFFIGSIIGWILDIVFLLMEKPVFELE